MKRNTKGWLKILATVGAILVASTILYFAGSYAADVMQKDGSVGAAAFYGLLILVFARELINLMRWAADLIKGDKGEDI